MEEGRDCHTIIEKSRPDPIYRSPLADRVNGGVTITTFFPAE